MQSRRIDLTYSMFWQHLKREARNGTHKQTPIHLEKRRNQVPQTQDLEQGQYRDLNGKSQRGLQKRGRAEADGNTLEPEVCRRKRPTPKMESKCSQNM